MKVLNFITIIAIFISQNMSGQGPTISYGIESTSSNIATVSISSTVDYNLAPFNLWNSLTFTIRYPSTYPSNLISSISNTSGAFSFSAQATVDGGDGFYYKTFVSNASSVQYDVTMGAQYNIADINFIVNNSGPALVEFVNGLAGSPAPAINNAIFDNVFSSFNPASASVVLPITIKTFSATKDGERTARLDWTSSSEINSDYIGIERSTDGEDWTTIGQVKAAGNSNRDIEYVYYDRSLPMVRSIDNIFYYRLRLTDFDGQYKYSETRGVNLGRLEGLVSIYPNPATDIINVDLTDMDLHEGIIHLSVYDNTGKAIISKEVNGAGIEPIQASNMAAGTYNVVVKQGDTTHRKQIIVVN